MLPAHPTHGRDCPKVSQLLSLLDGTLDDDEAAQVLEHLEACSPCDQTVTELETRHGLLSVAAPPLNLLQTDAEPQWPQLGESIDAYRLESVIGEGGMGRVYRATHLLLHRPVAVKIARRQLGAEGRQRFLREMGALGVLSHPNIVAALDAGESHGHPYLAMELIEGVDCSTLVRQAGPLPVADACEIARQAALALERAHALGFVHRDIKPSNLMLAAPDEGAAECRVKVLDFGLARSSVSEQTELTSCGQIVGTPAFLAPEAAVEGQFDHRADLYSLGVTLHRLLTGTGPAQTPARTGGDLPKLGTLRPLRELRPDAPKQLERLLTRLLAAEPNDRPNSAREVANQLTRWSASADLNTLLDRTRRDAASVVGMAAEPLGAKRPRVSRWRLRAALAASAAIVIAAAVTWQLRVDGHEVIIEVADEIRESLTVKLVREGDVVKSGWTLKPGRNRTTIRGAGVQVELAFPLSDEYQILRTPQELRIRRGRELFQIAQRSGSHPNGLEGVGADRRLCDRLIQAQRSGAVNYMAITGVASETGARFRVDVHLKPQQLSNLPERLQIQTLAITLPGPLKQEWLNDISHLQSLESLQLNASLDDQTVVDLLRDPPSSLRVLRLDGLEGTLGPTGATAIRKAGNLEHLEIRWPYFKSGMLAALGSLDNCRQLTLAGFIRDSLLLELQPMPRLETVQLAAYADNNPLSELTERGLTALSQAPKLRELELLTINVTRDVTDQLAKLPLQKLTLHGSQAQLDRDFLAPLAQLDALHSLSLTCHRLTDDHLLRLPELASLTSLTITGAAQMSDASLKVIANLKQLRELHLQYHKLSRAAFDELLTQLPKLRAYTAHGVLGPLEAP